MISLYSESKNYKLYHGDMLDMWKVIEPDSIDSIVTDPPYEIGFMNKGWDNSGIAFQKETWQKCLEVLKPGGHLLCFGGSRTFHRIACAIEDAGFEIRDTIMWLYGCLSEDTEVLTTNGYTCFQEICEDDAIRTYDIKTNTYSWEKPVKWSVYTVDKDICYNIKSDDTDQLVSRNHRCLVERNGKLVFEFAENLNNKERVPIVPIPHTGSNGVEYSLTTATITPREYSGIIFCPTVSTGCFVARRNGKVFITGNSGFPKSMNIGLAIDKKTGIESEVIGISSKGAGASPQKLNNHEKGDTGVGMLDGSGRTFEVKKAQNRWQGWGTQLKPAFETIIVARKPFKGSCVDNVLKYGVGGINIDECRVPFESTPNPATNPLYRLQNGYKTTADCGEGDSRVNFGTSKNETSPLGRFPANVVLTYDETDFDEVCSGMSDTSSAIRKPNSGSAARYFYCAKATTKDRDEGLEQLEDGAIKYNAHPCVKPTSLMQYLVRLVTPNGGTVLDPFNGSGSTGKAVMYENAERDKGYRYIGIEMTEEYLSISKARIEYVESKSKYKKVSFDDLL